MTRHVLIIPSWFDTEKLDGVFIFGHARMTASLGDHARLIYVAQSSSFQRPEPEWHDDQGVQYVILHRWYLPKLPLLSRMWKQQYNRLFKQYVSRYGTPEILHAHGYLAGMITRDISKRTGIPYVVTEHNTSIPGGTVRWYHKNALRHVYQDAAALIAVSDFLRRAMQQWTSHSDLHVIYNPVDTGKFIPDKTHQTSDPVRLLFIGELEPRKNLALLLRALQLLNDQERPHCTIVGVGPLDSELKMLSQELGIDQNLTWLGFQPPSAIPSIIQLADVLVSTSSLETFGMTVAEALCSGIPVIATDSGAPREFVNDHVGLIVPKDDPAALAEAIRTVSEYREKFATQAIREYAVEKFSFPVIARQVDLLYEQVLTNAR